MPEPSQIAMPEQFQIAMPEPSQIVMPEPSQIAMPKQSQIVMPEQSQIVMPEQSQIAMPEPSLGKCSPNVFLSDSEPTLRLTADVPSYALARCRNGDKPLIAVDVVNFKLDSSFDQSSVGERCQFYKKAGIRTYTVDVEVGWGDRDTQIIQQRKIHTISCAYDAHGKAVSKTETIADWFLNPWEKQTLLGANSTATFTLKVMDVLGQEVTSEQIAIGRKMWRRLDLSQTSGFETRGNCVYSPWFEAFKLSGGDNTVRFECTYTACNENCDGSGNASTYDVIVQYSSAYLAHTDEKHTVTCSDGGNVGLVGTVINSGGLDGIDLGGLSGQSVSQTSLNVPITMQVINEGTGNPVSSVIRVGERLTLQVSMDTTKPNDYVDFFVESCSSFNRDYRSNSATTSGQLLEKVLVLDRCPSPDAMDVLSGDLQKSANTVSIGFRGFKFEGQDSLYMSCSVKLCRAADRASCDPKTCDGSSTRKGYGRKRRQVDEDNKVNVTRKVFVVTFGDNTVMVPVDTSPVVEKERCMENTAFVAIVAVFGIVLTAAVVAAILLCLRTYHLQKEKKVGGKA
ncbi:uncharacterized protein LOC135463020 [Liolophura sinensis]|uniref:uncharacterized protein LOC135463020 n=1 Tax=Liolophura sinensis TaxID=3198878 RepID=UPI0031599065